MPAIRANRQNRNISFSNDHNSLPIDLIERIVNIGELDSKTIKSMRLVNSLWRVGVDHTLKSLTVSRCRDLKIKKFTRLTSVICKKHTRIKFDFFHPPHLWEVCLANVNNANINLLELILKFFMVVSLTEYKLAESFVSELRKIYAWMTGGCNESFTELSLLPNLKMIRLEGIADLTDSGLNILGKLTNIKELSIIDCPNVSLQGLQKLVTNQNPQDLKFSLPVSDSISTLKDVADVRSIWKINDYNHFLLRQIKLLSGFKSSKVKGLKLVGIVNLASLTCIAQLPSLHELTVIGNIDCFAGREISRLTRLQYLDIKKCNTYFGSFIFFQPLRELRDLSLRISNFDNYQVLTELNELTYLSIKGYAKFIHFFPATINVFPNIQNLRELELRNIRVDSFSPMLNVTQLKLRNCQASLNLLDSFEHLVRLKNLSIANTELPGVSNLHHFTKITSLEGLNLDNWRFSSMPSGANQQACSTLSALSNLSYLRISFSKMTNEHLALIETLPNLSMLDLESSKVLGTCQALQLLQTRCNVVPPRNSRTELLSRLVSKILKMMRKLKKKLENSAIRVAIIGCLSSIFIQIQLNKLFDLLIFIIKKALEATTFLIKAI